MIPEYKKETLKILYNKDTMKILVYEIDVSKISPTRIGDVVEEIPYPEKIPINLNNLYFLNNEIIELDEYEEIEDNKIIYNIEKRKEDISTELTILKIGYSEREFIFKVKYKQKNRELDKNNLTGIVTMLIATKQGSFEGWKFKDLEGNDAYVLLTLEDMQALAVQMMQQTTKAMKCESALIERINGMTEEELKEFGV